MLLLQWLRDSTGFIQQTTKKKKKAAKRQQQKSDKLKVNRNKEEAYNLISKQNRFKSNKQTISSRHKHRKRI